MLGTAVRPYKVLPVSFERGSMQRGFDARICHLFARVVVYVETFWEPDVLYLSKQLKTKALAALLFVNSLIHRRIHRVKC